MTNSRGDLDEIPLARDLETVKCITWNVKLSKGNEEVLALLDSGNEANFISGGYAVQLPLKIMDTSWGLATINKQQISTQGITDSLNHTRYFEETFLIADRPQPVVLGMPFLKRGNPDINWTARTMQWRQWDAETALMTTSRVNIIEPEDFIQQVLEKSAQTYICHVIMVEDCPPNIHPSWMAQILTTNAQPVVLPGAYKDFEDVFSI